MLIDITTKNIELTPSLRKFTEDKVGGLKKFMKKFEEDSEVKIFVELVKTKEYEDQGRVFRAEVNVDIPGKDIIRIEEKSADMHAAIDGMKDRLKRELIKLKEKKVDKKRKASRPNKP